MTTALGMAIEVHGPDLATATRYNRVQFGSWAFTNSMPKPLA